MEIIVLDGTDVPNPEDMAMLQALYSRSPKSVKEHVKKIKEPGASAKFCEVYLVQYGHKSIGDCGTVTICVENVSMLVAKAIQDWPLYNGQEASTRYLDMTKQEVLNPLGTPAGKAVQDATMAVYAWALDALVPILKELHPRKPEEKESVWEKAIKARAFDIARSLLPAGCTTYVAWHTNLRQAHDKLRELEFHPLKEPRDVGGAILSGVKARYPSSFSHRPNPAEDDYLRESMARFAYWFEPITGFSYTPWLDTDGLRFERKLLASRPPRAELHQRFRQYGTITFRFPIDFGSYRDLQRQRSSVQEMPLLTTKLGFHQWYLDNLPPGAAEKVEEIRKRVNALECDDLVKQYYVPMGFLVPVRMTCTLPSAVYIAELRSGTTVHATLRPIAQKIAETVKDLVPGIAMHHDMSPDTWTIKRGTQDIVKKEAPAGAAKST
jgi:thymidylate synthase ThyX